MEVKKLRTVNQWIDADETVRKPGFNKRNLYFLREVKQINAELARNNTILYFLAVHAGVTDCYTMLRSGVKQRKFVRVLIEELRTKQCYPEDEKLFKRDVAMMYERIRYVFKITRENVRLTEWYPFFNEVGFDRLIDMAFENIDGDMEAEERLLKEAKAWNESHQDVVNAHLEGVKKDIEIRDLARQRRKEEQKAEREAAKILRKSQQNEIKEMKHYADARRRREKKIERSFERYYKN